MTNFGACRMAGGLDLLAKLLGKPGKMEVSGEQVYEMHRDGKLQEINDYCLCDTLDTYFVFLRTRVMTEDLTIGEERELIAKARALLMEKAGEQPVIAPGASFTYTSGCPLQTPSGTMVGTYQAIGEDGEVFSVAIPAFSLDIPGGARVLN